MNGYMCYEDFGALLRRNRALRERRSKMPPINYNGHKNVKTSGYSYSLFLTAIIPKKLLQCNIYIYYIIISLSLSVFETLSITFWGLFAEKQRYSVL